MEIITNKDICTIELDNKTIEIRTQTTGDSFQPFLELCIKTHTPKKIEGYDTPQYKLNEPDSVEFAHSYTVGGVEIAATEYVDDNDFIVTMWHISHGKEV